MKKTIFGFMATALLFAGLVSFTPHDPQDTQQRKKRTEQQRRDSNKDTLSNRRMHDYKAPGSVDSIPERIPPTVPMPDTINKNMH